MKGLQLADGPLEAGYLGYDESGIITRPTRVLGKPVQFFSSTHERSHLIGVYAMSPFAQGTPCYALVWEGNIGSFYEIDERVGITRLGDVMEGPGNKYAFLFALADRAAPPLKGYLRLEDAGKLMALAAYSDHGPPTSEETEVIDFILSRRSIRTSTSKRELRHSRFYNCGVEDPDFKNLAGKFSDAIFDRFFTFARERLTRRLPLLISGGCGLNCEWNTRWRACGLFPDVFVPPCTNDTGSAIGTAADAQLYYTGNAKLSWPGMFMRGRSSSSMRARQQMSSRRTSSTIDRLRASWLHRRSSAGCRGELKSGRARWAIARSWPLRSMPRCEID
jgi:hydroxymethyl cephem carbamoyltransferase